MVNAKAVVEIFCEQCGWTWTIHNQYRILYERNEKRLRMLDRVAQDYFGFMKSVLVDYLYLQFAKLTDPATQAAHANLSAPFVASELPWPPQVAGALRSHLKTLLVFRASVIVPRSKIIAHADLKAHLSGSILGGFPKGDDLRFFDALQQFVNIAHEEVTGEIYPLDAVSPRDADNLVMALRRGVAFEGLWEHQAELAHQLLRESEFNDA